MQLVLAPAVAVVRRVLLVLPPTATPRRHHRRMLIFHFGALLLVDPALPLRHYLAGRFCLRVREGEHCTHTDVPVEGRLHSSSDLRLVSAVIRRARRVRADHSVTEGLRIQAFPFPFSLQLHNIVHL